MSTLSQEQINTLYGQKVYDNDGDKIGTVDQVWDDLAGRPTWISVKSGLFRRDTSLAPLANADLRDNRLVVAFDKTHVKKAPRIGISRDKPLSHDDVTRLHQHYGLSRNNSPRPHRADTATTDTPSPRDEDDTLALMKDTVGTPSRQDLDEDTLIRSEERLYVSAHPEEIGRARLRRYVVTESEQTTVPLRRETVRVERIPITEASRDITPTSPELTEAEWEVTVHAERPVVRKDIVPVERVRITKETFTEEKTISEGLRKERIEAELPDEGSHTIG